MYPNLLLNNSFIRKELIGVLSVYKEIKEERVLAKKNKEKLKDTFLKLVLNATSGILDNSYSWMYSPAEVAALRVTGQLILTRLLEELSINNFRVISLNTDGAETIVPKNRIQEYEDIVHSVGEEFSLDFEHNTYKSVFYRSVNSYLAIETNGKVKEKGEFVRNPDLGNSVDELIVPHALYKYFVEGVQPEDYIPSENNPFLFCRSNKIDKKYKVYWNGGKVQNLNRYYVSKKGAYLYKQKPGGNMENVLKGYGVVLYNIANGEKATDLNIDYQYYISKTREIIHSLEPNQLTLF